MSPKLLFFFVSVPQFSVFSSNVLTPDAVSLADGWLCRKKLKARMKKQFPDVPVSYPANFQTAVFPVKSVCITIIMRHPSIDSLDPSLLPSHLYGQRCPACAEELSTTIGETPREEKEAEEHADTEFRR